MIFPRSCIVPQETLDPNPKEFRIVAPVLVRDNEVIANAGVVLPSIQGRRMPP